MVKYYSILPQKDLDCFENIVIETKHGHIVQKHKKDYPIQYGACENIDENALITLGYFYPSDRANSHEELLQECCESSAQALEEREGEFVSIYAEGRTGEIHIVNDRFASRPFYITRATEATYFSSDLSFLLYLKGGNHEIDMLGWMQIFSFGHTLETRTNIRNIKRISPATHLIISPTNIIQEKQYWQLKSRPEDDLNPAHYSKKVFRAFQKGTSLRAGLVGEGVVALSGGLDSRLIAGALPKNGGFEAFTFVNSTSTSNTNEVRIAAEVAAILGLEHHIEHLADYRVSQFVNDIVMLTGGMRPLHNMVTIMPYIQHLIRKEKNFLLGGGPGDNLAGGFVPTVDYLLPRSIKNCFHSYFHKKALGGKKLPIVLSQIFNDDTLRSYLPLVEDSFFSSIRSMVGPTPAHIVSAWEMVVGFQGFTAVTPIHSHPDLTETFCHLDYTYCDMMLRLPADWLYNRNFYAFMIYRSLAQLRPINYANTGKPVQKNLLSIQKGSPKLDHMKSLISRCLKKFYVRSKCNGLNDNIEYSILLSDKRLLSNTLEIFHSSPNLKAIIDEEHCTMLLKKCFKKQFQDKSSNTDLHLMSCLITMCATIENYKLKI